MISHFCCSNYPHINKVTLCGWKTLLAASEFGPQQVWLSQQMLSPHPKIWSLNLPAFLHVRKKERKIIQAPLSELPVIRCPFSRISKWCFQQSKFLAFFISCYLSSWSCANTCVCALVTILSLCRETIASAFATKICSRASPHQKLYARKEQALYAAKKG